MCRIKNQIDLWLEAARLEEEERASEEDEDVDMH